MNAIEKGRKAKEILENEVFIEAIEMTKQRWMDELLQCQSADQRESLWHRIHALDEGVSRDLRALRDRGTFELDAKGKSA